MGDLIGYQKVLAHSLFRGRRRFEFISRSLVNDLHTGVENAVVILHRYVGIADCNIPITNADAKSQNPLSNPSCLRVKVQKFPSRR